MAHNRVTIPALLERKKSGQKITALTAYDYTFARYLDKCGVDVVLVGDSLGMVSLGYENTLPVTMEEMLHHTRAVSRGLSYPLLVGDMPFMSYQVSIEQTLKNAGRFLQEAGAQAVKLEGGAKVVDRIQALTEAGIPTMGHVGLTPQSVHQFGGYKVQGKSVLDGKRIRNDALKLQKAGAFAVVLEGIPSELAEEITRELDVPTIGIGAGPHCDGQILVLQDVLGMNPDFVPKFVKPFADMGTLIESAVTGYLDEVRDGTFPDEAHSYHRKRETLKRVEPSENG